VKVKHAILIKKGKDNVGLFQKVIEMPCLPPVGTLVYFGEEPRGGFSQRVLELSYTEESKIFRAYYELDIYSEQSRLKDYIDDAFFPKMFVNLFGFSVEWLEEGFENVLST
jgi:hypothetical protein